jgi:hypothetical protein
MSSVHQSAQERAGSEDSTANYLPGSGHKITAWRLLHRPQKQVATNVCVCVDEWLEKEFRRDPMTLVAAN